MLGIFNKLSIFFEDSSLEVGVREYARKQQISPPTASKILLDFEKKGLLQMREAYGRKLYSQKSSKIFIQLQRIYFSTQIEQSGLLTELNKQFQHPLIMLFGSTAKAENSQDSDIDIAIIYAIKKEIPLDIFEKKLQRSLQLLIFESERNISAELLTNIKNGFVLSGFWKYEME